MGVGVRVLPPAGHLVHTALLCYRLTEFVSPGSAEHGTLCRPEQPNKTAGALPTVDRSHHGGVFHPGRPRAGQGHGDQPHVRQTQRLYREVPGDRHSR